MKCKVNFIEIIIFISIALLCSCSIQDEGRIPSFSAKEIKGVYSIEHKSSILNLGQNVKIISPFDLLRFLSSIEELDKLGVVYFENDNKYIVPLLIPHDIIELDKEELWLKDEDKEELFYLIHSKQKCLPTASSYASTMPEEFSTIGIEVMHLLNYSEGHKASLGSNRFFCRPEAQDSLVEVYLERYESNGQLKKVKNKLSVDTLASVSLDINECVNCYFLELYSLDSEGYHIGSSHRLEFKNDNRTFGVINFPNTDVDVKNFSFSTYSIAHNGITLNVDWGGGNYFYEISFKFQFYENKFYLKSVDKLLYDHNEDKKITKVINIEPMLSIDLFNMMEYLNVD